MIQMMQELFPEGAGGDGNPFDLFSGMSGMPDMAAMADMAALFRAAETEQQEAAPEQENAAP